MENVTPPDPYEAVLSDLRCQRDRIDQAISVLEALRGGIVSPAVGLASGSSNATAKGAAGPVPEFGPGAFLGMTIHDAAKKLLASHRRQMQTAEIVSELERGGVVLTSADKVNTVGSILLRRFNTVGDIVRVSRGLWGLQEWYPGRKFAGARNKGEDGLKGGEAEQEAPAAGNVGDTTPNKPIPAASGWPHYPPDPPQEAV